MTFFRCPNDDIWGNSRCSAEPEWDKELIKSTEGALFGTAKCKLDKKVCGKYQPIETVIDLKAPWLDKPNFVETIIPVAGKETNKETSDKAKAKTKTIKTKKQEVEQAQKSMF